MWPMTVDRSALRQNMVSGMLDTIAYNVNRKNCNLAIYEIGKVFEQNGNPKRNCQMKSIIPLPSLFLV